MCSYITAHPMFPGTLGGGWFNPLCHYPVSSLLLFIKATQEWTSYSQAISQVIGFIKRYAFNGEICHLQSIKHKAVCMALLFMFWWRRQIHTVESFALCKTYLTRLVTQESFIDPLCWGSLKSYIIQEWFCLGQSLSLFFRTKAWKGLLTRTPRCMPAPI